MISKVINSQKIKNLKKLKFKELNKNLSDPSKDQHDQKPRKKAFTLYGQNLKIALEKAVKEFKEINLLNQKRYN